MPEKPTKMLIVSAFYTAMTAIGALTKIPLPLVPITLQSFFALLAAYHLPPRWAMISQLAYLILGLIGLPVFANGGGPTYILQPTFGYLFALPCVAWGSSHLFRTILQKNWLYLFAIIFAAQCLILLIGSVWLYFSLKLLSDQPLSINMALSSGIMIFLPATLLKSFAAVGLIRIIELRLTNQSRRDIGGQTL